MATLLKDHYNKQSVAELAEAIQTVYPDFHCESFYCAVFAPDWEKLELKTRLRRITECLGSALEADYLKALKVLRATCDRKKIEGLMGLVFPDFVALYGLEHWRASMLGLAKFTSLCSSEFAVRPFIEADTDRMMHQMMEWSHSQDTHLRRLASEGCRPRLPWAEALPEFKKDPAPILPILEQLKADPSELVRRSVANNLNDISKDHPDLVLKLGGAWFNQCNETDWVVKHGCRSLLKQGDPRALLLFGYRSGAALKVSEFELCCDTVAIGASMGFQFTISGVPTIGKIRIEYRIGFVKKGGEIRSKVFKISEGSFGETARKYQRKHSFKQRSTRLHYPGQHSLTLLVNGVEKGTVLFLVTE